MPAPAGLADCCGRTLAQALSFRWLGFGDACRGLLAFWGLSAVSEGAKKFTIGRDKSCDIPIADDSVSRVHAELTLLGSGQFLLADNNSSNGTSVLENGKPKPVRQAFVTPSDQVQFGAVVLSVSQLLEAIEKKVSRLKPAAGRAPAPGARLLRCDCGAVRSSDRPCPECGQP